VIDLARDPAALGAGASARIVARMLAASSFAATMRVLARKMAGVHGAANAVGDIEHGRKRPQAR
jgi:hypothetical protein